MKASDLVNVLNHIPGNTEVDDIKIKTKAGLVPASKFLSDLKKAAALVEVEADSEKDA